MKHLALLVGLPLALLGADASARTPDVHHILILDDSGSMEIEFDNHGFGLAVPQLFHRVLGDRASDRLTVFTLPAMSPTGHVPRLNPGEYLGYERRNGTHFAAAIQAAIDAAGSSDAEKVSVVLVTDAEPTDPVGRQILDRALSTHETLSFACVVLGGGGEGDVCEGRAEAASDGFDMMRIMARHLARTMNSVPLWGRLATKKATAALPVGRFVKRVYVLMTGTEAGHDFAARVKDDAGELHRSKVDHTRRMGVQVPGLDGILPPLSLQTLTIDHDPSKEGDFELALDAATGPVAYGVILEYDLEARLEIPPTASVFDGKVQARAHLVHRGNHFADADFFAKLHIRPTLVVEATCEGAHTSCTARRELPMKLGADGWAVVDVPLEAPGRLSSRVRFAGDTVDMSSEAKPTIVSGGLGIELEPVPEQTSLKKGKVRVTGRITRKGKPVRDPKIIDDLGVRAELEIEYDCAQKACPPQKVPFSVNPDGSIEAELPLPDVGEARLKARVTGGAGTAETPVQKVQVRSITWLPPVMQLPEWVFEDRTMRYHLRVVVDEGRPLTAAELEAEKVQVDFVVDGRAQGMTRVDDHFELVWNTGTPRRAEVKLVIKYPGGETPGPPTHVDVVPDAAVALAPEHHVGPVESGCRTDAHCIPLDFTGSRRLEGVELALSRTEGHWSDLRVTVRHGERVEGLPRGDEPFYFVYDGEPVELCYAPPRCTEVPETPAEFLSVRPTHPRLVGDPARAAQSLVTGEVSPNSWLSCNLWWILIVSGGILFLFIVYGYIRPHSFPGAAAVQVANKLPSLVRDPGRPLRSVPLGRRGFYRSASCGFDGTGFTTRKGRVLELRAEPGGQVRLVPRGSTLERKQRGRWLRVVTNPTQAERGSVHEPYLVAGAVYRVNQQFYFKVTL